MGIAGDIKRKNGNTLAGGDEAGEGRAPLELHYHLIKILSVKKYNGINYDINKRVRTL